MNKFILKSAPVFLFVLLLAAPFTGQTNEWTKYKNADGNFMALFPGEPKTGPVSTGGDTAHTIVTVKAPAVYTVIYTRPKKNQVVNDAAFEAFKSGFFEVYPKNEISAEGAALPAFANYIGHSYRSSFEMNNVRVKFLANLYLGKHQTFAVMVSFPASEAEPAEAKKFMESFALIDPDK
jgi:hypothetical protein